MRIILPNKRAIEVPGYLTDNDTYIIWEYIENRYSWEDKSDEWLVTMFKDLRVRLFLASDPDSYVTDEDDYNWAVPGWVEYGDRIVITGTEGTGKSTLIMQWLVQVSAGIHPLTEKPIDPKRALLIDLEYGSAEIGRRMADFETRLGRDLDNLKIISKPEGWNLLDPKHQKSLRTFVDIYRPDVIGISPLYKAFEGDETDDVVANQVTAFFNELREENCVIIVEAHVPHAGPSGRRPERPIGSSVWTRWPEFGIFLASNGELRHFRGARDASREWPAALKRGGKWPWTAIDPDKGEDLRWSKLRKWAITNKRKPSTRQAAEVLGISQTSATKIIKAHANDWPEFE